MIPEGIELTNLSSIRNLLTQAMLIYPKNEVEFQFGRD